MMDNITAMEKFLAHLYYWRDFIRMIISLRRTFLNSSTLLLDALNHRYPIEGHLRNGKKIQLQTFNALYLVSNISKDHIEYEDDLVTITSPLFSSKKILIHGGVNNGDIVHVFLGRDYEKLPVRDRFVVDIGANIGDTALFFVTCGAKKVIAVEPYKKNFDLAKKNIQVNDFGDKIELLLAGCAAKTGFITIDPQHEVSVESVLEDNQNGIKVPLVTLEDIVKRFEIPPDSILKIDCEGCEYDIINNTPTDILQKFSHIQIEYHYGYRNLKNKLEKCGFEVRATRPHATDIIHTLTASFKRNTKDGKIHQIRYVGFIHAKLTNLVHN